GGQIGERRFDENPSSGFVHLPESLEHFRVAVGRSRLEERAQVGVRLDATGTDQLRGALAQRRFAGIASDHGQRSELIERSVQGRDGCRARFARNRRASLSVRQAQWAPAWAPLWFQWAGSPRASR